MIVVNNNNFFFRFLIAPKKGISDGKRLDIVIRKQENKRKRLEKIKFYPVMISDLK